MLNNLIEFKNLKLSFGEKEIFNGFNLTIYCHQKILILGKSGKGKSCLINALLGFQNLDGGDILFKNQRVKAKDFRLLRQSCAYVNQDVTLGSGLVLDFLREIAAFSYNNLKFKDNFLDEKLLSFFDLDNSIYAKNLAQLSGGERQRLALVVALSLKREIIVLDEPTSSLDDDLKLKIANYFAKVPQTVIVISHDHQWLDNSAFTQIRW